MPKEYKFTVIVTGCVEIIASGVTEEEAEKIALKEAREMYDDLDNVDAEIDCFEEVEREGYYEDDREE